MESLEEIWLDHSSGLLAFIRGRIPDRNLAEDILQDVFLKVHSKLGTLNNEERLQSWLYQITRHTMIDYYRRHRGTESLPDSLPLAETSQEAEWWQTWAKCVRPMIELLPSPYRDALLLSDIDGLPLKEVAERLGLSLPGAKSRVQRGRVKLKQVYVNCCQIEFDRRGNPIHCESEDRCRIQC